MDLIKIVTDYYDEISKKLIGPSTELNNLSDIRFLIELTVKLNSYIMDYCKKSLEFADRLVEVDNETLVNNPESILTKEELENYDHLRIMSYKWIAAKRLFFKRLRDYNLKEKLYGDYNPQLKHYDKTENMITKNLEESYSTIKKLIRNI